MTIDKLIEKLRSKIAACGDATKEQRARKGAYADILADLRALKDAQGEGEPPVMGVVLTYGLVFDKSRLQWVTIEATKFDEQTNAPVAWAVRRGDSVMSKFTGNFDYEPRPSMRDDDFFNEYRFQSPDEATACWSKHSS